MEKKVNEIIPTSKCLGGFISHSKTWGLSGEFPIAFNMFELTDMEGYYGDISHYVSDYNYQWELDIYNQKYQLLPHKLPSVRSIMLSDNLEDYNEDGSCKDAELEARMRLCEFHAKKNRNNTVRGRINEWIKPLRPLKEKTKKKMKQDIIAV